LSHEFFFGKQVVADKLGNIFEKSAILKLMVEKKLPADLAHISSLKDLLQLEFSVNPDYSQNTEYQAGAGENFVSPYFCPITNLPVNGKNKFCALLNCGHVFSTKGLKSTTNHEENQCYVCQKTFLQDDILILNPTDEEKSVVVEKLLEHKKVEKEKKRKLKESERKDPIVKKKKLSHKNEAPSNSGMVGGGLNVKTSLKVAAEGHNKKKKVNDTYQSIFTKNDEKNKGIYMTGIYIK